MRILNIGTHFKLISSLSSLLKAKTLWHELDGYTFEQFETEFTKRYVAMRYWTPTHLLGCIVPLSKISSVIFVLFSAVKHQYEKNNI